MLSPGDLHRGPLISVPWGSTSSVPRPAGQFLKPILAVGVNSAFAVRAALIGHPRAELVAIVCYVGLWYTSVTVVFDVVQESAEALFPLVDLALPCPAVQFLKPVFAVGIKGACGVPLALRLDPRAQVTIVGLVRLRDIGITVAFDVVQESAETFLPLVGPGFP